MTKIITHCIIEQVQLIASKPQKSECNKLERERESEREWEIPLDLNHGRDLWKDANVRSRDRPKRPKISPKGQHDEWGGLVTPKAKEL